MAVRSIAQSSSFLLHELLSTNCFLSTDAEAFQDDIRRGFLELLSLATDAALVDAVKEGQSATHGMVVYDLQYLLQALATLNWSEILTQHDESLKSSSKLQLKEHPPKCHYGVSASSRSNMFDDASSKTRPGCSILEIILQVVQDPGFWPVACHLPMLTTLIQAILENVPPHYCHDEPRQTEVDTTSRPAVATAQKCVRQFVLDSLHRIPALRQESNLKLLLPKLKTMASLPRIRLRLRLMKEWISEFPSSQHCFVPNLGSLLDLLDQMEIESSMEAMQGRLTRQGKAAEDRIEWGATNTSVMGRTKFVDRLHGDDDNDDEKLHQTVAVKSWRQSSGIYNTCRPPSTKRALRWSPLNSTEHSSNNDNALRKQERQTRLSYRTKCIELILAMQATDGGSLDSVPRKRRRLQQLQQQRHNLCVLNLLLDEVAMCCQVSSLSFCIILWVDQCDNGTNNNNNSMTLLDLAGVLWKRRNQNPVFVAFFFELLAECSYFDTGESLFTALDPFTALVSEFLEQASGDDKIDDDDNEQLQEKQYDDSDTRQPQRLPVNLGTISKSTLEPFYRYHFAWFLTRRGAYLKNETSFASTLTQLSVLFGNVHDWIPPTTMSSSTTEQQCGVIIEALQFAGILGVSSCTDYLAIDTTTKEAMTATRGESPQQFLRQGRDWCYTSSMGTCGRRLNLFSTLSLSNGVPVDADSVAESASNGTITSGINDMINADVLSLVFSYLGYKRVVWLRTICSEWRSIADCNRLWSDLYRTRYPFLQNDEKAFQLLESANYNRRDDKNLNMNDDNNNNSTVSWKQLFQDRWVAEREVRSRRCQSNRDFVLCGFVGCYKILNSQASQRKHHEQHCCKKVAPQRKRKALGSATSTTPKTSKRKHERS